jgi:hypothetical protein
MLAVGGYYISPKGTLAWDFFVLVFCTYKTHIGQIKRLQNFFDFGLEFADLFKFFNIRRWLNWREVSLLVNWVNTKWDSTSSESTQSETPRQLSQRGMVKSSKMLVSSALTQLTLSLTPRWLSWQRVSLRVDSVDGESNSVSTQCEGDESSQNRHT